MIALAHEWLRVAAGLLVALSFVPGHAATKGVPAPKAAATDPAPSPGLAPPVAPPVAAAAASAPLAHRPLRQNQPAGEMPAAAEPRSFTGYEGVPSFSMVPRQHELALFPCSQCHQALPPNPQPRALAGAPHVNGLSHGQGRMWCLDCHVTADRDRLRTVHGAKVAFDDSHLVCGSCHGNRHRDWYFGAHGKRLANWQGERLVYACTHCHDPHAPALAPRAPSPPPPVRAGLAPMQPQAHEPARSPIWRQASPSRP